MRKVTKLNLNFVQKVARLLKKAEMLLHPLYDKIAIGNTCFIV